MNELERLENSLAQMEKRTFTLELDIDETQALLTLLDAGKATFPEAWPPFWADKAAAIGLSKKHDRLENEWKNHVRTMKEIREKLPDDPFLF